MRRLQKILIILLIALMSLPLVACAKKKKGNKNNEKTKEEYVATLNIGLGDIDKNSVALKGASYDLEGNVLKVKVKSFPFRMPDIVAKEENLYFNNQHPANFTGYVDKKGKTIQEITKESSYEMEAKFSENTSKFDECYPQSKTNFERPDGAVEEKFQAILKNGERVSWANIYYKGEKYEQLDGLLFKYEKVYRDNSPMDENGKWSSRILDYSCYDRHLYGENIEYKGSFLEQYLNKVMKKKMNIDTISLPAVNGQEIGVTDLPRYDRSKTNINEFALSDYARYKVLRAVELNGNVYKKWETKIDADYLKIWTRSKTNKQNYMLALNEYGELEIHKTNQILGIRVIF